MRPALHVLRKARQALPAAALLPRRWRCEQGRRVHSHSLYMVVLSLYPQSPLVWAGACGAGWTMVDGGLAGRAPQVQAVLRARSVGYVWREREAECGTPKVVADTPHATERAHSTPHDKNVLMIYIYEYERRGRSNIILIRTYRNSR